jgi:membrane protease YdiL (CAAX protease family)
MEPLIMGILAVLIAVLIRRKEALTLRYAPERGTWVAIGTGLLAWALSASLLLFDRDAVAARVIHYGFIYVICGVAIPWGYTLLAEQHGLAWIGIHRGQWKTSLVAGGVLAALLSLIIVFGSNLRTINWMQFAKAVVVLNGAGGLFELFLYYGFLHLRLEKAFGVLPAIVLTSLLYVTWHTGTQLPLEPDVVLAVIKLFSVGLMYQAAFSTTRNLLIIWPLFHGAGVMIDFTINLDEIAFTSRGFPWAVGTLVLMAITSFTLYRVAAKSTGC